MKEFLWPVRVYYEDTDSGGVVYYANYLKFMERSRTEWLRSFAIEQDELLVKYGIIFAVRSIKLDYLKPARFNQQLQVSTQVVHQGRASITFHQQVFRMEPADVVENNRIILCEGQIKIACLDADSFQPKAIPAVLPITTEDKH